MVVEKVVRVVRLEKIGVLETIHFLDVLGWAYLRPHGKLEEACRRYLQNTRPIYRILNPFT